MAKGVVNALKKLDCNHRLSFISPNYKIGKGTEIYYFVNIIGKGVIGDHCLIASYVEIQNDVIIQNNCRIGSFSFLCSGVEIGNRVFLGSHVKTINDKKPEVFNPNYKQEKIIIDDGASIGTGVTLMGPIRIGKNAIIGANSLVNKDVPEGETWVGSPAKRLKRKTPKNKEGIR